MAETNRPSSSRKTIRLIPSLAVLSLFIFGFYIFQSFKDTQARRLEQQTLKNKALKGKVWMERANKAHDSDNHDEEFELLLKSANLNHMPAIARISNNYESGHYIKQSDLKAQEWAMKLPEMQYLQFLFRRGHALTVSGKSPEDIAMGIKLLEEAITIAPENQSKKNALERIAWLYFKGDESIRNLDKAQEIFEIIGGTPLENFLGSQGFEAEQLGDRKKARDYFQAAVDKGSTNAKVSLAYNYLNDTSIENSWEIADKLMREVTLSDEINSRFGAAKYFIERGSEVDKSMGIDLLENLANDGFERSKLYLAEYYSDNPNVEADYIKAAKHLESLTYLPAQAKLMLAHMKRTGTGTTKDLKAAFELYEQAANDSYYPAKLALGHMHRLGLGTPKNPQKAKEVYEAARHDEHHAASYYLGLMYEQGQLGAINIEEAINLYGLASEAEYGPALMRLAKLYERGQHVPKDNAKAFRLMTEAAYEESPGAIENLAHYYSEGIGTERNNEYADIWRSKKNAPTPFAFDEPQKNPLH